MININLTPVEELEDRKWWLPDLIFFAAVIITFLGGVDFYLNETRAIIEEKQSNISAMESEVETLKVDAQKYSSFKTKVEELESKKDALMAITKSKILRYLPIILIESLQTLKPEGLWFEGLEFLTNEAENQDFLPIEQVNNQVQEQTNTELENLSNPESSFAENMEVLGASRKPIKVKISGKAISNIIIAEFMSALNATKHGAFEKSDLRTQAFFSDVNLSFSQIDAGQQEGKLDIMSFDLILTFEEKDEKLTDSNLKISRFIEAFKKNGRAEMR